MTLSKITGADHMTEEQLKGVISYLYSILDDIDSTGDVVKGDDVAYRARVEYLHLKRGIVARSVDGQTININAVPEYVGGAVGAEPVVEEQTLAGKNIYYSLRITGLGNKKQRRVVSLKTDVLEVLKLGAHQVYDPLSGDLDFMLPQAVVAHDKRIIDCCEILIVDLCHGIGAGSMLEMAYAKDLGKHIIALVPDYDAFRQMSCWITAHVDVAVAVDCLSDLNYIVSILGDTFYK